MKNVAAADGQRENDGRHSRRRGPGARTRRTAGWAGSRRRSRKAGVSTVIFPRGTVGIEPNPPPLGIASGQPCTTKLQRNCDRKSNRHRLGATGAPRITWMSRSRIFLRSVLRLTPEQLRGLDLVAAGRGERRADQRIFDLPEDAVIEAGRRQALAEALEIGRRGAARPSRRASRRSSPSPRESAIGRLVELALDDVLGDRLLRVERGEPADQVLELADVAGPAVALQPLDRRRLDLLWPAGPPSRPA